MDKIFLIPDVKKIVKINVVSIDNVVFRFHYRITALVLVVASLMISATQFFGNPISCILHKGIPKEVVESYCWVESTFTLPKALGKKMGDEVPYPGVDKHEKGDERIEHSYYQWVCILLFLQACMFLIPHILWKGWEKGKLKEIILELNKPAIPSKERASKYETLVSYFMEHGHGHLDYFFKLFLCEILNFVNVVGQIFLIDKFLHGEFTTYGSEVFQFMMDDQEDRIDPMIRVFPRMTKCIFHHYGPSGDVQKLDTYCVLPLNILNEKIYVFIWFWFVILALLSGLALIYRVSLILSGKMRLFMMRCECFLADEDNYLQRCSCLDLGDWFILYMLGCNIDNLHFLELVNDIGNTLAKNPERYKRFPSTNSLSNEAKDTKVQVFIPLDNK